MRRHTWSALALFGVGLLTMTAGIGDCCDEIVDPCTGEVTITSPSDGACIIVNTEVQLSATVIGGAPVDGSWFAPGAGLTPIEEPGDNPATVKFPNVGDFEVTYATNIVGSHCSEGFVSASVTVHVRETCGSGGTTVDTGVFPSPVGSPDGIAVTGMTDWAGPSLTYGVLLGGVDGAVLLDPMTQNVLHPFSATAPQFGAVALKGGLPPGRSGAQPTDAFVRFGGDGAHSHVWDDSMQSWSAVPDDFLSEPVLDAVPFADSRGGATFTSVSGVGFYRWVDDVTGYAQDATTIPQSDFPAANGPLQSAFARGETGSFLAVTGGGFGRLYLHDRVAGHAATFVGPVGSIPRRVRVLGTIFAVTSSGSDSLFVGTWDLSDNVAITDSVAVGDGPAGVDLLDLNGSVAAVTTGSGDNTVTVTVIDASGHVSSNVTNPAPTGIVNPTNAAWIGTDHKIIVSGYGSDNYAVMESGL